uniref:Phosphatidylinositol 3-kinase catalytic subunit type 3 n=1 Tax=Syphacia muris TaxID=451379 RepID=A0A0N5AFY1_9BILA
MEGVYRYVHSCEVETDVKIRVCSLEGVLPKNYNNSPSVSGKNFFVTLSVYCNQRIVGFPVPTSYKSQPTNSRNLLQNWDEWITLPIKYSELSRDAFVHICLWDVSENINARFVGHTMILLFSRRGVYKHGSPLLRIDTDVCEDTPLKPVQFSKFPKSAEVHRLLKHTKAFDEGLIEKVGWLDRITFSHIESIKKKNELESNDLYLRLEMPVAKYDQDNYAIVYFENNDWMHSLTGCNNVCLTDPEIGLENLCETKHLMMTRNARTGKIDQNLKPNAFVRDTLNSIIQIPSTRQMSVEQRDLIWKFRYYLKNDKKALVKFIRTVNWKEGEESVQALELISNWEPVDAADALELLSPAFENTEVRKYAVSRLASTSSDQILIFLPQLVQALKYEASVEDSETGEKKDNLSSFLIRSACNNTLIANHLYWLLKVEVSLTVFDNIDATEKKDPATSYMYLSLLSRLSESLSAGGAKCAEQNESLQKQQNMVNILVRMSVLVSQESGGRSQKEIALRKALREEDFLLNLNGLSLPLDPSVHVKSIVPDLTTLFQSNLMPMKLTFNTTDGQNYVTIFKKGDDLRQDMLVVQMFRLMDKILKDNGLDLKFTLYSVLATSVSDGFVQFVKASPLRNVVTQFGSIQEFLRSYRPSSAGPFGIELETFQNYVRSCAGYSIVCYILGIGDRHLDNLLLCENGRLFHVDFGFILGRDPKPLPPLMKLTSDMINAMGGTQSPYYQEFRTLCLSAFSILRRQANLILNLFTLMLDADIPDIAIEKEKAVQKIEQRFQFELTEELADQQIQTIIDQSHADKLSKIVDFIHDFKQMISN